MERNVLDAQQGHWQKMFAESPEMFGTEPYRFFSYREGREAFEKARGESCRCQTCDCELK